MTKPTRQGKNQPERRVPGPTKSKLASSLSRISITSKGGPEQEHLESVARGNCACLYSQALHRIPPPSPCDSIIHLPLISLWSESSIAQVMEAASHGQTDFPATGQDNLSPQVELAKDYVLGCLLTTQPCVWPNLGRNQICQPKGTSKGRA